MNRSRFTRADVVIAGLALLFLAAVILPGLGAARELPRRTVCKANLYGLATAWQLYHQDYNGRLVQGPCIEVGSFAYLHKWNSPWVEPPHEGQPDVAARVYTRHNSTLEEKQNGI